MIAGDVIADRVSAVSALAAFSAPAGFSTFAEVPGFAVFRVQ